MFTPRQIRLISSLVICKIVAADDQRMFLVWWHSWSTASPVL